MAKFHSKSVKSKHTKTHKTKVVDDVDKKASLKERLA